MAQNTAKTDTAARERTAFRWVGLTYETRTWRTRAALARAIRAQESRGARAQDWTPCVALAAHEGFDCV